MEEVPPSLGVTVVKLAELMTSFQATSALDSQSEAVVQEADLPILFKRNHGGESWELGWAIWRC